jgi:hypothetical protein
MNPAAHSPIAGPRRLLQCASCTKAQRGRSKPIRKFSNVTSGSSHSSPTTAGEHRYSVRIHNPWAYSSDRRVRILAWRVWRLAWWPGLLRGGFAAGAIIGGLLAAPYYYGVTITGRETR